MPAINMVTDFNSYSRHIPQVVIISGYTKKKLAILLMTTATIEKMIHDVND